MYAVRYRETYEKTYFVDEADATTKKEAIAWVGERIENGYLDGPEECVNSTFSAKRIS